ncbi:MAG: hypothetical protein AAFZ65_04895 [Planctomycetota bacterium]
MRFLLLTASLLSTPAIAQTVLVVGEDAGPDVDFTSIIEAVSAAEAGDVILVRDGSYFGFILDKPLSIYAEGDGALITSPVTVRWTEPGEQVVLQGLTIVSSSSPGLGISENEGLVWLEELDVVGGGFPLFSGNIGVSINSSSNVAVTDCNFAALELVPGGNGGEEGLIVRDSNVWIYDTAVQAGLQLTSFAAAGAIFHDSTGFVASSTFMGGPGPDGSDATLAVKCSDGAMGGSGVRLESDADLTFLSSQFIGGPGGAAGEGGCLPGEQGLMIATDGTAFPDLQETVLPPRGYTFPNPLATGTPAVSSFFGTPGELAWGLYSVNQAPVQQPLLNGVLFPSDPLIILFVGVIPASGQLDLPYTINLPAGTPFAQVWQQPVFFSLEDSFVLGTPRAALVIGAGS